MRLTHLPVSALGQRQPSDWTRAAAPPTGGTQEDQLWRPGGGLQGLQRENGRLQEQLRSSEELNASLRTELDLHRSIMAQIGSSHEEPADGPDGSAPQVDVGRRAEDAVSQTTAADQARTISSGKFRLTLTLHFFTDTSKIICCSDFGKVSAKPSFIHLFIYFM